MQTVYCKVRNCGYCGSNGFCLNRLTVINQQGMCKYLTKSGWDQKIDQKWFNNYDPPEEKEDAAALLKDGKGSNQQEKGAAPA